MAAEAPKVIFDSGCLRSVRVRVVKAGKEITVEHANRCDAMGTPAWVPMLRDERRSLMDDGAFLAEFHAQAFEAGDRHAQERDAKTTRGRK